MSLICIFAYVRVYLRTSYWLYLCAALPRLSHAARRVAAAQTQFTGRADLLHLRRGFTILSRQTLLSEDRQCYQFWRDAELGVRAVCCEGSFGDSRWEWKWVTEWYDWQSPGASPLSRSTVFLPHHDTAISWLTNDTLTASSSSTDCYDDWHQASPTVRRPFDDASSLSSTTPLPRRVCFSASAACR